MSALEDGNNFHISKKDTFSIEEVRDLLEEQKKRMCSDWEFAVQHLYILVTMMK